MCMHKTVYMYERMGGLAPSSPSDYSLSRNPPFTHISLLESARRKPLSSAERPQYTAWHSQSEHRHVRNALFGRRLMTVKLPHSPVIHACRRCSENSQLQYTMGRGEGAVHCFTLSAHVFTALGTCLWNCTKALLFAYILIYLTASPSVGMRMYGGMRWGSPWQPAWRYMRKRGALAFPSPRLT